MRNADISPIGFGIKLISDVWGPLASGLVLVDQVHGKSGLGVGLRWQVRVRWPPRGADADAGR